MLFKNPYNLRRYLLIKPDTHLYLSTKEMMSRDKDSGLIILTKIKSVQASHFLEILMENIGPSRSSRIVINSLFLFGSFESDDTIIKK